MQKLKPIKNLGQNYLIDPNIIRKFVNTINPQSDDVIIEIGPGKGAISRELLHKCRKLIAIDIDKRIIEPLKNDLPEIDLINDDFLKIDLQKIIATGKVKVVGNIPFNLTSPILFKLVENIHLIQSASFIMQHEVAKRICAGIGTKEYGILTVILNYIARPEYCFKISPNVFYPRPKVDSAVLKIEFNESVIHSIDLALFIKVVKASFGNRRKTLKNSLSNSIFGAYDLSQLKINLNVRAEQMSIEEFLDLTREIKKFADKQ